jgi:hypothetical protein
MQLYQLPAGPGPRPPTKCHPTAQARENRRIPSAVEPQEARICSKSCACRLDLKGGFWMLALLQILENPCKQSTRNATYTLFSGVLSP